MSTEEANPLITFFHAVMDELQRKLTPEKFQELLEERNARVEKEGTEDRATSLPKIAD